jgi:hypothetical protein
MHYDQKRTKQRREKRRGGPRGEGKRKTYLRIKDPWIIITISSRE